MLTSAESLRYVGQRWCISVPMPPLDPSNISYVTLRVAVAHFVFFFFSEFSQQNIIKDFFAIYMISADILFALLHKLNVLF